MVVLTPEHGYVILAASGSFLVNFWQMMKIGGKRKELKIEVINFWKRIAKKNYQDLQRNESVRTCNFLKSIKRNQNSIPKCIFQYPQMWSEQHPIFNCYQRAHQNTLEVIPFYLALLPLGGVRHPLVASGAGVAFLVARILYSLGYYSGNPKQRIPGAILSMLSMLTLFGCSISTAAELLKWW